MAHSKETKQKISDSLKGHKISKKTREKIKLSVKKKWKDGHYSDIDFSKSQETKYKISKALIGNIRPKNEFSPNWKGDEVSYQALHSWVRRNLGTPDMCFLCNKSKLTGRQIHWANISHEYKRDLSDWVRLCQSCHKLYDNGKISI